MNLIYVADDDKNLCEILKQHLENEGFAVRTFLTATDLYHTFLAHPCQLIISDIMMPMMNGYELCKKIRLTSEVPFIMLSAKGEEIDRVLGLELGGDDYLSKPFSLRELTLKIKNILRRRNDHQLQHALICKDVELKLKERAVYVNQHVIKITSKEFDLLHYFIQNKNLALSRDMIIEEVWGYKYVGDSRQVDHAIKRLRKKLLEHHVQLTIETIWGFGYKVNDYEN